MKNRPKEDEFTEAMHSEFWINEETDRKHRTYCALSTIKDDDFTREEALEMYDVTEEDIAKYEAHWVKLQG